MNRFFRFPRLAGIDPSRLFQNARNLVNSVRFPTDCGMMPVKPVLYRPRSTKFFSFPMLSGITPDMEVFTISRILPEILLSSNRNIWSDVERFTIERGSCPPKGLLLSIKRRSWLQFAKEVMNSHPSFSFASSLTVKYRSWRAPSLPKVGGTYPLNLFSSRTSTVRSDRLDSDEGMVPVN
ncbi:hypothetical protein BRADI_2g00493v3 [Brachypodium distachyon]|uniref:Uncharacterized protein n=1 Tax=Brachypodium distachyon TaxID=15368 RepID=A0A0Q3JUZ2_BRADI|nr:hypothetical protein BRADI_2g00493v3 [Brachypodium distachyon]